MIFNILLYIERIQGLVVIFLPRLTAIFIMDELRYDFFGENQRKKGCHDISPTLLIVIRIYSSPEKEHSSWLLKKKNSNELE